MRKTKGTAPPAPTPTAREVVDPRPQVKLKNRDGTVQTFRLDLPSSHAVRFAVWLLQLTNPHWAYAAALGLAGGPKASGKATIRNGDVAAYGAAVIDHLVAEGVPYNSLIGAGVLAWSHVTEGLGELSAEVADAEGFSAAPPAGSTG